MKKIILILIMFIFISCESYTYKVVETFDTTVHITEVYTAKHSKVNGYIIYKNTKLPIDNGSSGYHYKKYNLSQGDTLPNTRVTIYQRFVNGKKDIIYTSELDVSWNEIKE